MVSSNMNIDEYRFLKPIKVGGQATVELWRHFKTEELVAIKTEQQIPTNNKTNQIVAEMKSNSNSIASIQDPLGWEAKILTELHQYNVPGVVPFKGIVYDHHHHRNNILDTDDSKNPCKKHLILGYCNRGNLIELLKTKPNHRLCEDEACRILKSLVRTLKCCHALGIMHRDIKLENVFLVGNTNNNTTTITTTKQLLQCRNIGDNDNTNLMVGDINNRLSNWSSFKREETLQLIQREVKKTKQEIEEEKQHYNSNISYSTPSKYDYQVVLGDFGLATYFECPCQLGLTSDTGSIKYMAPEVIQGKYDERADVWSLGVLLHCLLIGFHPFQGYNEEEIEDKILNQHLIVSGATPHYRCLSLCTQGLLSRMLDKNPSTRITLEEIQNHPWLANNDACLNVNTQRAYRRQCCIWPQFLKF